jgi:hypothetical protein
MAGLDDLIEAYPSLAPVANAIGMKKTVVDPAELPVHPGSEKLDLFPRSTRPTDLPKELKFYRADPTGKGGGKDGLETLPVKFINDDNKNYVDVYRDPDVLYKYARLAGAASKYGYPTMAPEEVATFALKEGRADLGHNGIVLRSKKEKDFDKQLAEAHNLPEQERNFLTTVQAKKNLADRKGISFAEAWNGTGTNVFGQSGKDYAKNWEAHKAAAGHPKNKEFMNFINRAYEDGRKHGFPSKANVNEDTISHIRQVPYKKGGMIDKPIAGGYKTI